MNIEGAAQSESDRYIITLFDIRSYGRLPFAPNSSPNRGTVTRMPHFSLGRHASFSRALSLLLLVFVLYGTTVAAAHRHGRILDAESGSATSVSQPNNSSTLNGGQLGCNECALCQFHRHSSTALITIRISTAELNTHLETQDAGPIALKSQTNAPQQGRAPPFTS